MTNQPAIPGLNLASDSVRDMAGLLHLWSGGRQFLAVLRAYIDEAGLGDGPTDETPAGFVFASAGFIGAADDWEKFSVRWTAALVAEGVPSEPGELPELHMNEMLHGRGSFSGWDKERRARLQGTLIDILKETPAFGHGCVIARGHRRDWENTHSGQIYSKEKHYYGAGLPHCIVQLARKIFVGSMDERIGFVCGDISKWKGDLCDIYESMKVAREFDFRHRLGAIAFGSPKHFPPLQAADLLAYETRRKYIDWKDPKAPSFRRSLVRLESSDRITYCTHDKTELEPQMERSSA
ncbi:MAG: hypothetical protein M3167_16640 [Acidobacteriota bacterium]|nr:hypothetical protein [Acidobacteriota bacterium]